VDGWRGTGGSRCGMASGSPAIWTSLFMCGRFLGRRSWAQMAGARRHQQLEQRQ
jgi:hypothetical protein